MEGHLVIVWWLLLLIDGVVSTGTLDQLSGKI